jgi:hypothetical protein
MGKAMVNGITVNIPKPQTHRFEPWGIFLQHHGLADGEGNAAREPKKNARRQK